MGHKLNQMPLIEYKPLSPEMLQNILRVFKQRSFNFTIMPVFCFLHVHAGTVNLLISGFVCKAIENGFPFK